MNAVAVVATDNYIEIRMFGLLGLQRFVCCTVPVDLHSHWTIFYCMTKGCKDCWGSAEASTKHSNSGYASNIACCMYAQMAIRVGDRILFQNSQVDHR